MPVQTFRTSRLFTTTFTASSSYNADLRDSGISGPLVKLGIRVAATYALSGTSTLAETAPIPMISNFRLSGNHRELGTLDIYNGEAIDLYYMSSFLNRTFGRARASSTSGAGQTAAGYFELPLRLDETDLPIYLDSREFASLSLTLNFGTNANSIGTNVSTTGLTSTAIEIFGTELLPQGAPDETAAHFIPRINTLRQPTESGNTALRAQAVGGGFVPFLMYRQRDDSAAPSAPSVEGLTRKLAVIHRGIRRFDGPWTQLSEENRSEYGVGTLAATNNPAGVAIYDPDRDKDGMAMIDARVDPIYHEIDTSTTPNSDITAVTPASSDLLIINAYTLIPNARMSAELAKRGLA